MKKFILTFLLLVVTSINTYAANLTVGKAAPTISIKTLDGQSITNSSAKGHILIVHLWATWCDSCRKEMPALENFHQKYQKQGVEVVAVSVDDRSDLDKVKSFLKDYSFKGAIESNSDIQKLGRIWRVPVTFVIDQNGILRKNGWEGDPLIDEAILEKIVAPLLAPTITN
jgi:thiol-disulfide isomerase/thioredoxin